MTALPAFDAVLAAVLRREAEAMARAYCNALLDAAPAGSITGVYAKGSVYRPWDSLIDYVPELSDVDIHVRFADAVAAARTLGTVEQAMVLARRASAQFALRFPDAVHRPRPQLVLLDDLERQVDYVPSPPHTVRTLYGVEYPCATAAHYARAPKVDRQRFLADAAFIEEEAPGKLVDRPGRLAWHVVSLLVWRVGPAGPRLLTQLGMAPAEAWSLNRTAAARELAVRATPAIAEAWAAFYLAGWAGFRSAFTDGEAAAAAVLAAARVFRTGRALLEAQVREVESPGA